MKLMLLLFSILLAMPTIGCSQMPPPPGGGCLDNCGAFDASCRSCHNANGSEIWIADQYSGCEPCSNLQASAIRPQVPMRPPSPSETLIAFVKSLAAKRDPKVERYFSTPPDRHIALMERAVRLKLDGPALGRCSKAFRPGTLELLPAEIAATRLRLLTALVVK